MQSDIAEKQLSFMMELTKGATPRLVTATIRVLDSLAKLIDTHRSAIWEANHVSQTLTLGAEKGFRYDRLPIILGFTNSFVGYCLTKHETLYVSDANAREFSGFVTTNDPTLNTIILIPVMAGRARGARMSKSADISHVIILYPKHADMEFTESLFEAASTRVGYFLSDAEEIEREFFRDKLFDFAIAYTDFHAYLKKARELIQKELLIESCSIFYYDDLRRALLLGATSGLSEHPLSSSVFYGPNEGATGTCFMTNETINVTDVNADSNMTFKYREITENEARTFVAVPIRDPNGNASGVIRCTNKLAKIGDHVDVFPQDVCNLLEYIGQQIGHYLGLRRHELSRSQHLVRMMHEVHAPVSSIRVTAQTLLDRVNLPPRMVRAMLEDIRDNSQYLDRLADGVSHFSLPESERLKRYSFDNFSISELFDEVESIVRPLAKSRGRPYKRLQFSKEKAVIWHDRDALCQILVNLVSNAIKYFDDKGQFPFKVSIETEFARHFVVPGSKITVNRAFVIRVSDYGIGIQPSEYQRVFDAGFRSQDAMKVDSTGLGIGLALVKQIVEDLDGAVYISNPVNPTTFVVVVSQLGA